MSGPGIEPAQNSDGAPAAEPADSLDRAAAAGPLITTDDEAEAFEQEPSAAHDSAAAIDGDRADGERAEAGVDPDFAGTEHPELASIYGPAGEERGRGA